MTGGLLDVFRPEQERPVHGRHAGPAGHALPPEVSDLRRAGWPGASGPGRHAASSLPTVLSGDTYDGWVPAGTAIEIAGRTLPGGMLYVGKELRAPAGGSDPALIDPRLPVDCRYPDWSGSTVGHWPSYSSISAQARAAYLAWLAGGRSHPGVPMSWVFLFFYGLERRVIVDAAQGGPATEDRQPIAAEVGRLLDIYGGDSSFHYYATQFLLLIEAVSPRTSPPDAAPPRTSSSWFIPLQLRSGLGRYAAEGRPVPADWALSWAHFHPDIYPRTPAQRCPGEFEQLFRRRYVMRHGAGLQVQPENILHRHTYVAASPGIRQVSISSGLPDVLQLTAPTTALKALVEECTGALDAYSRYLGRHPGTKDTLPAIALLPAELVDHDNGEVLGLMAWIDERLGQHGQAVVDGGQLSSFWPAADHGNLAKAEAVAFAQLLGTLGVGVEPDARIGGPVLSAGPAVVFRAVPGGQQGAPSAAYAAATLILHLAAAVSLAGGRACDAERAQLRARIAAAMHLTEPERARLAAHLTWLLAGEVRLTGLSRRIDVLEQAQRESIGDFLATVATADGVISPAEITTLIKIFRLLGLDSASVYSRVHSVTATSAPATEPVIVQPGIGGLPGIAVPPRPAGQAAPASMQPVRLDETVIAAKVAETAAVSALLGSIFAAETPRADPADPPGPATRREFEAREPPVAGLDAPHSALLRALAGRDSWSRADLEAECAAVALLPDGALDTLNEAAYEAAGDPLAEGEDPIDINPEVAREMLA